MAPTTRSNRAAKLAVEKSGIIVNSHGLLAFPNELYLEILSHMPALPIPHDVWVEKKPDPYWQLALYSLSQTCRSLRAFFLPYAWERIEIFGGMWTPKGRLATTAERYKCGADIQGIWDKKMAAEILRQLRTVTARNPHLRIYVSIVNLAIPVHYEDALLPEIARRLSLLPKMCTLQLNFRCPPTETQQLFSNFRYYKVHTLNISRPCPRSDILRACPNTKYLSLYKDRSLCFEARKVFAKKCAKKIERLGLQTGLESYLSYVVNHLPRLSDVSLDYKCLRKAGEKLNCLSSLRLHTIRLRLDPRLASMRPPTSEECRRWIELAKKILTKCPWETEMEKKVIVVNVDKTVEIHHISLS